VPGVRACVRACVREVCAYDVRATREGERRV